MSRIPNLSKYPVIYNGTAYRVDVKYDSSDIYWTAKIVATVYVKTTYNILGIEVTRDKKVYSLAQDSENLKYDYIDLAKAAVIRYEEQELEEDKKFRNAVRQWNSWDGKIER